ncbi:AHL_G0006700.mRNA.1.CDS.1 [Saccharomyces cerevisiae]|nr:AIE_G0006620.mRNA.1.CDS.1 [Saccharomyces cerevisiae]CAI4870806.1 AHL_G0006700.mRNA.1.CDS.1 [Saccharomyces cerevisiae]CAI6526985.1 AIE_G0006620.mRNA.1.CDS.1 [Saccharomyces cerevisiae]CAI6528171.1 AHL_G0006700.mRNA.1.CDS.1 [Saccharomyces cerevisiae]
MNVTGENPLLFKCGTKGYINQTYTPKELYDCGVTQGKEIIKEKNPNFSVFYHTFPNSLIQVHKRLLAVRWAIPIQAMTHMTFILVVICKEKGQKPMREYIIQDLLIPLSNLSYCSCL